MLGDIVINSGAARAPVNEELTMANAVLNTIKAHVNGFEYFLFDTVIGKTCVSGVVYTVKGRRLGMSKSVV